MKFLKFLLYALVTFVIIILLFGGYLYFKKPYTPPIVDGQGNPIASSIASLEKVRLGGVDQWICIRGKDIRNPILLFLPNGPGLSEMAWVNYYNKALESSFVVVTWDQRGAAKSYSSLNPTAVPDLFKYGIETQLLIRELSRRFKQEKIYVVGHSWGSLLGLEMARKYQIGFVLSGGNNNEPVKVTPISTHIYAFVSISQKVTGKENDQALDELLSFLDWRAFDKSRLEKLMGALHGSGPDRQLLDLVLIAMTAPEYSLVDKINWFRGLYRTRSLVSPKLKDLDLLNQAQDLDVPVYFLVGRNDYKQNIGLAEEYFNYIQAPQKELIWFEKSGNNLCFTEADKFNSTMINKILPETYNK